MRNIILKIFRDWDPVGLTKIAPSDEYQNEAIEIEEVLRNNRNISVDFLTDFICETFVKSFSKEVFLSSIKEVKCVAEKVLKETNIKK